ncbi:unnamed protein product [Closterium sp. NIES-53]
MPAMVLDSATCITCFLSSHGSNPPSLSLPILPPPPPFIPPLDSPPENQRVIIPSTCTTRFLHGTSTIPSLSVPSPKPIPRRGRPPKIRSSKASS